jgi:hypothetical protein
MGTQKVIVDEIIPLPFHNWTFRESELTGRDPQLGRLSDRPLDKVDAPIFVRYASTNTTFEDQDEILLFARDPEQLADSITLSLPHPDPLIHKNGVDRRVMRPKTVG